MMMDPGVAFVKTLVLSHSPPLSFCLNPLGGSVSTFISSPSSSVSWETCSFCSYWRRSHCLSEKVGGQYLGKEGESSV